MRSSTASSTDCSTSASTASTPTMSTAWSTRSPASRPESLYPAEGADGPDAHEGTADDEVLLDRTEGVRGLGVLAVVAEHEDLVVGNLDALGAEQERRGRSVGRQVGLGQQVSVHVDVSVLPPLHGLPWQRDHPFDEVVHL